MSEMLANQYFLARRFSQACDVYEKVLENRPEDKFIQRKLIICYTQIGEIKKALDVFISCLEDDIECIVKFDPVAEDCPCPELTTELEKKLPSNLASLDFHLMLGMLWLYCDEKKSIGYFLKARQIDPENAMVKYIISLITSHQKKGQVPKISIMNDRFK
jgi:tetratricopeptide (TPR) repeat protein